MKTENKILALSTILGLFAWFADSALDYFFLGQRSFWELLLRDTAPHEIYVRLALSVSFFIFGIITSRLLAAHRRTKEYLATTLHSIGDAVIATDTAGIVTFLNPTAHQLTGWAPEEAAGRPLSEVFPIVNEKTGEQSQYPLPRVLQEGVVVGLADRTVLIARDGIRRPIDDSAAPIKNKDGDVVGAVLIFRDITEHRKAVEALREEKGTALRYLNIAAVIIVALDAQGKVTLINWKGCQVLGYTEEEIIGQDWFDNFLPERIRAEVKAAFAKLMAGEIESVEYFENPVITKTGEERIIAWHNKVLTDKEAAIIGTLSSGEDITDRQRTSAALQESEEKFRTIFTTAEDCIFIKDQELKFTHVNPSVERLFGLPAFQLVGRTEEDVFGVKGGGHIRDVDARALAGETIEEEVTRPVNGVLTTLHVIKTPMRDKLGAITGLYGIARNITHRKRSEDALRESEVRLQRQNAALAQVDMRKILVRGDLNTAVRRITEAAAETLEVERVSVWLYNDDCSAIRCIDLYKRSKEYHSDGIELEKEKYPAYFAALEEERTIAAHDARIDPRTREFLDSYLTPLGITSMLDAPIRSGGQIAGVICHEQVGPARRWTLDEQNFATSMADSVALALEISERKRAEEAVQERERFLLDIFTSIQDGISILDNELNIIRVNPAIQRWYSHAMPLVGKKCYQAYHERSEPCEVCPSQQTIETGEAAFEVVAKRGPGGKVEGLFDLYSFPFSDTRTGHLKGVIEYVRDITDRKQAEEALRESEEKYRHLVERANDGITIVQDSVLKFVNPRLAKMLGYTVDEMTETPYADYIHPDEREKVRSRYTKRMAGEDVPPIYETALRHHDGQRIDVEVNAGILKYRGAPADLVYVREITERTRFERAARQAEHVLQQIFRESLDVIMIIDADGEVLKVSEVTRDVLGYATDDLVGKNCSILFPPQPEQSKEEFLARLRVYGGIFAEQRILRADGSVCVMDLTATVIPWEKGKAILATFRDVTDRRHAGETLRKKRKKIPLET